MKYPNIPVYEEYPDESAAARARVFAKFLAFVGASYVVGLVSLKVATLAAIEISESLGYGN